jgi:hypothetical protein
LAIHTGIRRLIQRGIVTARDKREQRGEQRSSERATSHSQFVSYYEPFGLPIDRADHTPLT